MSDTPLPSKWKLRLQFLITETVLLGSFGGVFALIYQGQSESPALARFLDLIILICGFFFGYRHAQKTSNMDAD